MTFRPGFLWSLSGFEWGESVACVYIWSRVATVSLVCVRCFFFVFFFVCFFFLLIFYATVTTSSSTFAARNMDPTAFITDQTTNLDSRRTTYRKTSRTTVPKWTPTRSELQESQTNWRTEVDRIRTSRTPQRTGLQSSHHNVRFHRRKNLSTYARQTTRKDGQPLRKKQKRKTATIQKKKSKKTGL